MRKPPSLKENSIVIHPTSNQLQIGRSTDIEPEIIPHCIARKRRNDTIYRKNIIPNNIIPQSSSAKFNNAVKLASIALKSSLIDSLLPYRHQPALADILQMNKTKQKMKINPDPDYIHIDYDAEFYIGETACKIPQSQNYNLFWPYSNGKLNEDYSFSAVIQDLEDIWGSVIEKVLRIPRAEFGDYNIILVIDDILIRREVRWIVDMIFTKLKFGSIILQFENVCITYSTGISTGCIVSINENTINISCIEEGISIPESRIKLMYGFCDILFLYHNLIQRIGGLTKDVVQLDYTKYEDAVFLWKLFANNCMKQPKDSSLNLIALQNSRYVVNCAEKRAIYEEFQFHVSSEHIIAGLSLFYPTLITKDGLKYQLQTFVECDETGEPDDPWDDFYLSMTTRDKKKAKLDESVNIDENNEEDNNNESRNNKLAQVSNLINDSSTSKFSDTTQNHTRPLPLTDAIVKSIKRALTGSSTLATNEDPTDAARQFIETIILTGVGPGFCSSYDIKKSPPYFPGFKEWLKLCLQDGLSRCGDVNIISDNTDEDEEYSDEQNFDRSSSTYQESATYSDRFNQNLMSIDETSNHLFTAAWRGAAMIPLANCADDLLITSDDWMKYGSRAIKEKAPFQW